MKEPLWLASQALLAIHEQLIAEHGGASSLRDKNLLESALAAPRNHFSYGERDLCVLAAVYANSITRNHPFADGNKRSAFMAAYTFLGINGVELNANENEVVKFVIGLSAKTISEEEFVAWLRSVCVKRRRGGTGTKSRRKKRE